MTERTGDKESSETDIAEHDEIIDQQPEKVCDPKEEIEIEVKDEELPVTPVVDSPKTEVIEKEQTAKEDSKDDVERINIEVVNPEDFGFHSDENDDNYGENTPLSNEEFISAMKSNKNKYVGARFDGNYRDRYNALVGSQIPDTYIDHRACVALRTDLGSARFTGDVNFNGYVIIADSFNEVFNKGMNVYTYDAIKDRVNKVWKKYYPNGKMPNFAEQLELSYATMLDNAWRDKHCMGETYKTVCPVQVFDGLRRTRVYINDTGVIADKTKNETFNSLDWKHTDRLAAFEFSMNGYILDLMYSRTFPHLLFDNNDVYTIRTKYMTYKVNKNLEHMIEFVRPFLNNAKKVNMGKVMEDFKFLKEFFYLDRGEENDYVRPEIIQLLASIFFDCHIHFELIMFALYELERGDLPSCKTKCINNTYSSLAKNYLENLEVINCVKYWDKYRVAYLLGVTKNAPNTPAFKKEVDAIEKSRKNHNT